jgi:ABC-2 type transport system permease protein
MQDLFADPKKAREQVHKSFEQLDRAEGLKPQQRQNLKEFLEMMEEAMGKFDPQLARKGGVGFQPVLITKEEVTTERTGPRSPWEVTFPSAVLWGMLGCVTGFSISLVSERVGGTWLRLQTAPVSRSQVLAGKGLACFLACALVTGLLLTIGRQVLGVGIENYPALVLGAACTAFCFTGIMMFLCTLGKTERAVAGIGWGAMMPLAMIGGGMIPLFVMPAWLQTASHFSPVKWGIVALEGPIWRGYGLADMLLPCGILAAVGAAGFGVGMAWLSRQEG